MSDNPDLTPEGENPDDEAAINAAAKELFNSLDSDPMTEAWIGFHEFYRGLINGGFPRDVAVDITAAYLVRIASGGGSI